MKSIYLKRHELLKELSLMASRAIDFCILSTSSLNEELARRCLNECARIVKDDGLIFVHGLPQTLPSLLQPLMDTLTFKYWIAIESTAVKEGSGLPTAHAAVVLFSKQKSYFRIAKVRFPHRYCAFCNKTLKDWGGKAHLMHPDGFAISDVWRHFPKINNYTKISLPVLQTLFSLANIDDKATGIVGPLEAASFEDPGNGAEKIKLIKLHVAEELFDKLYSQYALSTEVSGEASKRKKLVNENKVNPLSEDMVDKVYHGDIVEVLKNYPSNSIDLAFADPPYNLDKMYNSYEDKKKETLYLDWCNSWLKEYIRVLKPTGSLFLLNLPKWAIHHANFLNQYLFFQNWIVWDAVSEPRGKLMPSHYALLFYTKHPTDFIFNHDTVSEVDAPTFCLRASCIKERKKQGIDPKISLTDIWWDIHRIKHKKERDPHPCQLPEKLMERIILLTTNEGDVVLDGLCGTGTTPIVASKLRRRYIAIDLDKNYVEITKEKLQEIKTRGCVRRESIKRYKKPITKKQLQLELRELTKTLGRLPTEEDIRLMSKYSLETFKENFPSLGKALKAAKLEVMSETP
jgi:site-specific DNA-methyltransferase (adenine-specific)